MDISEKIKNQLKKLGQPRFDQKLLNAYCRERFLYRLSVSNYVENFYLKGGSLIYLLEGNVSRPTLDIDLYCKGIANERIKMESIFQEICNIPYEDDGLIFENIKSEEIKNGEGIRLNIEAKLNQSKVHCAIDIGFDDVVLNPQRMDYPIFLENLEKPNILAYSVESLIAEKFQAMIDLGETNGRLKDFYDVHRILSQNIVNWAELSKAIKATFENRETPKISNHIIFNLSFYKDLQRVNLWNNYLKRNGLGNISFEETFDSIQQLKPFYEDYINS